MSKAKDYYSKSVPEAIRKACDDFATSQEKLDIEVLETGSMGIFGLCKKRAHIRVNLKKNEAPEASPKSVGRKGKKKQPVKTEDNFIIEEACETTEEKSGEKVKTEEIRHVEKAEKSPLKPEETGSPSSEVLASIQEDLEQIIALMGFTSEVVVRHENESVQCNIKSEYEENIIGQEGRTLDSLQYLIRKMVSSKLPDRTTVDLDIGNFREQRKQELQKLAQKIASQVKETGKTQAIPALNPSERRVVHVALQDDKKIRSRSVGDGIFKKVLIFKPGSKGRKSGGKRKGRQGGGSAKQ